MFGISKEGLSMSYCVCVEISQANYIRKYKEGTGKILRQMSERRDGVKTAEANDDGNDEKYLLE